MKKFASFIICFILLSCTSSNETQTDNSNLLSDKRIISKTTNLSILIPKGWFEAEDNDCNCTDLWIVKHDYSESMIFRKMNIDDETLNELENNGLAKAVEYSRIFVKTKPGIDTNSISTNEVFKINENDFNAYQYENPEGNQVRTVVFEHRGKFFEMETVSKQSNDTKSLFLLQNAVLSTLN